MATIAHLIPWQVDGRLYWIDESRADDLAYLDAVLTTADPHYTETGLPARQGDPVRLIDSGARAWVRSVSHNGRGYLTVFAPGWTAGRVFHVTEVEPA